MADADETDAGSAEFQVKLLLVVLVERAGGLVEKRELRPP
jgi:hypothetical protein